MIEVLPRNIFRFVFLVLFQILVLNNIQFSGYLNPFLYILFILLLPFETPSWLLLFSGFLLGMTMDLFTHTPGLNTAATVFLAFVRPFVLARIAPRDGYETGTFPRIFYYGFSWFLKYALILTLLHHAFLFYMEIFRFSEFFSTLLRVLISSLITLTFIMLSQYVIFRK